MNYKQIFKTLRYTCLFAVIVLGLITIIGTGGSSDNGSSNGNDNDNGDVPAITPKAGAWLGTAEFGEIEFTVSADRQGIEKIKVTFVEYSCGHSTRNGSITINYPTPLKINNAQFTATFNLTPNGEDKLFIEGFFDTSEELSGFFELTDDGVPIVCTGALSASHE